jgi:hypothetical protein
MFFFPNYWKNISNKEFVRLYIFLITTQKFTTRNKINLLSILAKFQKTYESGGGGDFFYSKFGLGLGQTLKDFMPFDLGLRPKIERFFCLGFEATNWSTLYWALSNLWSFC